ncbi:KN motif and ankyrin repeat domain-containing protein 1a isoform X1 [Etheostoma cragini]|uniref:KN motif and ankyrin repeat domain-containing protein 1a isoform X1 n=2 Tax=Etheostoma cragini TaxID=417921 RepID=UPI00155E5624|nr:KN motif and ankyrin repeat domain-containing protein 1a isoform X1 [Etheostoma cragini]XP_034727318.1 KN motif and ankyrin repeat domain-containing protein 1a isoform X1 [Etheostoma cragini]XP_034727319.1 KN motif and ankyrin repeat domain-containing protein 1a isoform X1 [Etheostoma cragini]XP_034727320.1 KN motif and ankyrin repeat domain-containing protein 1a isoform X1 [Etheostoma cragini]
MAQTMHVNGNGPERGQRCPSTEDEKDSVVPYYVETPYGYQLDLDFLKYVDDIERGNTIKKLSIQRKPKLAKPLAVPRGSTGGGSTQAEWTSTDSLSSSNSDDKQSPVFFNSRPQVAVPLTPTLSRASCEVPQQQSYLSIAEQKLLLPPPSPRFAPRHNPQVEKTLMETRFRLEQERLLMQPHSDPPMPRRRLASFGGMGSSSSLSSYSSSMAPSQISPSTHNSLPINGHLPNGEYNHYYPPSMGSSIRHSPMSSGMATPVTNVSPLHLQQIREQMVVALRKLKELEEQVKTIPILQVKIAVLQEEKRQLAAQSKNQGPAGFRKRSYSVGCADQMENPGPIQKETELHIMEPEAQEQSSQRLDEFRRLAAEVQALEKTTQDSSVTEIQRHRLTQNQAHQKSIGIVTDENMNSLPVTLRTNGHCFRDAGVSTERQEMRSAAVGVTEAMLGMSSEAEREIELQQQTIEALKEKIYRLEVQLKETTHQIEMGKLKLELQAAGGSNKKKADKGLMARPEMYNACVEAKVQMRSQGVGDHLECSHADTVQSHTIGVSCQPSMQNVATGPEIPMDRWVVRERVELTDQCVGRQVEMCHQQVGMELNVCEVGVNTEESVDSLALCKPMTELSKESRSVGCGDCLVDVNVSPIKTLVSQGTDPEYNSKVDFGVMAAPELTTQHTNTETEAASKSTNTKAAVLTDSFTDMGLITCDKHTNTAAIETRTVAAGEGLIKEVHSTAKMRSIAIGTTTDAESFLGKSSSTKTKECGVGPVGIHENFLVGLKTRNIACGPSQPTESVRSSSKETVEVETEAAPLQAQTQGGAGLDHYIERVQKLLQEQQMLLAENYSELADAFGQPQSQFGSINSQLVSTLSSINTVMKYGSAEDILKLQSDAVNASEDGSQQLQTERLHMEKISSCLTLADKPANTPAQQQVSAAEQKSRMDLQMSTALHGQPCSQSTLKSIMKKKDGRADSSGTKKNLQFVGVNGGRYETTSSDDSSSEDSSSSGSDEEEEETEKELVGKEEEYHNVEGKCTTKEFQPEGAEDGKKEDKEERSEKQEMRERYELSEKMLAASNVLKTHLSDPKAVSSKDLRACLNTVQHEWFRVSSQKAAVAGMVEDYLRAFGAISEDVLRHIVNMADGNGNTALHYSVSHSNFQVVKKLLDADVCNVNQQNKAGYTPIMLAALAAVESPKDMRIVDELFSKGDVNARASQAGQTGLMLAVSHGRMDMVRALLAHAADVNIQDDEGSTALMCASEHGHVEIVKLLLAQPGCDATLSDSDESNALSIALEAGHKDIAVLLYAHVNFSKAQSPGTPRLGRKTSPSPTRRGMFD